MKAQDAVNKFKENGWLTSSNEPNCYKVIDANKANNFFLMSWKPRLLTLMTVIYLSLMTAHPLNRVMDYLLLGQA